MMPRTNTPTATLIPVVAWGWLEARIMAAMDGGTTAAAKLRRLMCT